MSAEQYSYVEQDRSLPQGGDDLPTYDDLAAQNGPNSRFGRWRGWIEKRAAERYADLTPEERLRRRERGWEPGGTDGESNQPPSILYQECALPPLLPPQSGASNLHIQTNGLSISDSPVQSIPPRDSQSTPLPFVSQAIPPSHLKINHFGSRFLPHATSQIRCVLPLMAERLVLIGHDEGLSVLDMFPQEWTDDGEITVKGPDEAQARVIWRGESVYQMTVLELEDHGEGTPQGVVLALVGPEPDSPSSALKDSDFRALRMYNLGSLTSLARWTVAQKGTRPLDLYRPSNWQVQQTPVKKHRPQGSIARSIKSLIEPPTFLQPEPASSSYQSLLTPASTTGPSLARTYPSLERDSPARHNSDDSTWDMVDDLPLRWATDYVPLASPGSRLANTSVYSYTTWRDENRRGTGGQLLAIATKNSILLYESPKGERAYRFVKDFYTPLQPRSILFFQQLVQDAVRTSSDSPGRHKRTDSGGTVRPVISEHPRDSSTSGGLSYGTQLSLFVIFDKKASWIRLADSAVGEFELRDDAGPPPAVLGSRDSLIPSLNSATIRTRSRLSFDIRESLAKWILPTRCDLPIPYQSGATRPVYLLTRGKRTHILPCPLPSKSSAQPPLHVIYWKNTPKQLSARICALPKTAHYPTQPDKPPLLQLMSFGENGLEVYEAPLTFLSPGNGKGKGKGNPSQFDAARAEDDLGGDAGFLVHGGNWDKALLLYGQQNLDRSHSFVSMSTTSAYSVNTINSIDQEDFMAKMKGEVGAYGWCRKGMSDYRVFWVGGTHGEDVEEKADDDFYA